MHGNRGQDLAAAEPIKSLNPSETSNAAVVAQSSESVSGTAVRSSAVTSKLAGVPEQPDSSKQSSATDPSDAARNDESHASSETNDVKRVVDEMVSLMGDIHDAKQEIMARGIAFHTVNVLVEMTAKGQKAQQANMRENALQTSREQHGSAAITPEQLDEHLATLAALEKDLGHVRKLGKNQGLDMTAINYLTQIIRQNPGDGGVNTVNTFLGYAIACEMPVDKVIEVAERAVSGPESVLPDIARKEEEDAVLASRKQLIRDVGIGILLAILALTLLA